LLQGDIQLPPGVHLTSWPQAPITSRQQQAEGDRHAAGNKGQHVTSSSGNSSNQQPTAWSKAADK